MFVEHKEAIEITEVPAKTLKLSEAIRKGKPLVGTEQISFRLCALGCAWAGVKGRVMTPDDCRDIVAYGADRHPGRYERAIAEMLGYPAHLGSEVNSLHCQGTPALQIADWLEAQGH